MPLYIMLSSLLSILWFRNSIITMLLSLELLLISCLVSFYLTNIEFSPYSILFFLSMMVSGSAMGLSLLVATSRHHHSSSSFHFFLMTFDKNYYPISGPDTYWI